MKKVLIGFIIDGRSGGVDSYILNFLESVKDEDAEITLMTNETDGTLKLYLEELGVGLLEIPRLRHPFRQYRRVCEIIKEGKYDTVYLNISTAIDCVAALAAKRCGVKKRVIHSHASGNDCESRLKRLILDTLHKMCRGFLYRTATDYYGASRKAGLWMFPEKIVNSERFSVILSAVDKDRYTYNSKVREEVRRELEIEENFVIGHIGNFCPVKNYGFIIKIFNEIRKKENSARLLLVGDGPLHETVKKEVEEANLLPYVIFTGWRTDTFRLVQGMDVFLLPSLFEGLSIVSLEAQCAQLPCVVSDTVPEEVEITDACKHVSLSENEAKWADTILQYRTTDRKNIRFLPTEYPYDREEQKEQLKAIL